MAGWRGRRVWVVVMVVVVVDFGMGWLGISACLVTSIVIVVRLVQRHIILAACSGVDRLRDDGDGVRLRLRGFWNLGDGNWLRGGNLGDGD